jgi:tape measure domain-containing protein
LADINVGDVVARLRADATQFDQAIQSVIQRLGQLTQASATVRQGQSASQQSTSQLAQAYQGLVQAVGAQTQAYAASSGALNGYKQSQDAAQSATQQTTQAVSQQAQAMQQTTQAVSAAGGALRTMGSVLGALGISASIGAIVSQLKELASAALAAGIKMDALKTSFTAVQGQAAGQLNLSQLFALAQKLGVEFGTLATSFRSFSAATAGTAIEGAKAAKIFEQVVTGARAMGASSEQTGRALLALQQIVSTGTVTMENLRGQFAEAIPGGMQIAARAMGTTTEGLNKLVEKGQDSIDFAVRLGNQFQTEFGGKAAEATNTAASAFARLRNELEQLGAALAASGLLQGLRDVANSAAEMLATWRKARDEQQRQLGGPAPQIPRELQGLSPAMDARQKEIERQRAELAGTQDVGARTGEIPGIGLPLGLPKATPESVRALQEEQRRDVKRLQDALLAEGAAAGSTGPSPVDTAFEGIQKTLEAGREKLKSLDVGADLLPSLDVAKQKLQAWDETLVKVQVDIGKLSPELAKSLGPQLGQMLAPANQLFTVLQADVDLAGDAKREVADMRSRVAEREQEQAQAARELAAEDKQNASVRMQALRELSREEEQAIEQLRALGAQYLLTRQARDQDTAATLAGALAQTTYAKEATDLAKAIKAVARVEEQIPALRRQAEGSARRLEESQERSKAEEELQKKLAQITRPRGESLLERSRREALGRGLRLSPQQEEAIEATERWQDAMRTASQIGDQAASTLTNSLLRIVDGTESVSQGFKQMAASILKSISEITLNSAFKQLIGLGITVLGAALAPSTAGVGASAFFSGASAAGGGGAYPTGVGAGAVPIARPFQHGGVVSKPTHALIGEAGTEFVLSSRQMQMALAQAIEAAPARASGAEGRQGDVYIYNVRDRETAEREAQAKRAQGHRAIVNSVVSDLSQGSGSTIGRAIRAGGH